MTKEVKHEFFGKVLTEKLKELKAETGMTQEQFAESVGVQTPNSVTDWKKGYSKPKKETLKKICEVLKCDISDFSPKTHSDLYKYDLPFITKVGKKRSQFAKEIGFDMRLLSILREHINFDEDFPIYSNITRITHDLPGFHGNPFAAVPEYIRNPNFADSKTIADDELKDLQIYRDNKTITFSDADILFLKHVQDQIIEYASYLFYKRQKEMVKEVQAVNDELIIKRPSGSWIERGVEEAVKDAKLKHDWIARYFYLKENSGKDGKENG